MDQFLVFEIKAKVIDLVLLQDFVKCVGGGHMRRCPTPKITQYGNLITVVIFIYKLRGTYLISSEFTQFQPQ